MQLKPRIRCIVNPANIGAGLPDVGLYTPDQFVAGGDDTPPVGTIPARGAVEAKMVSDDTWITADSEQVTRYWGKYGTVLVTNFRDFLLVGTDSAGKTAKLEHYRLAESEKDFWAEAKHAHRMASQHGDGLLGFLKRVLLHEAPLDDPKDVASFLASYARAARNLIGDKDLSALKNLREALEEVLGLAFTDERAEHFFRSTLVQSLFYGIFSAWVFWSRKHPPSSDAKFDWRMAQHELQVPALRKLLHELTDPGQLKALHLPELLDWTGEMLNRVRRASFFESFKEHHAVQYFYEPFLEAYDPELRKGLGVWYTPREVVRYMVERVDHILRTELGIADGLAAKNVLVLDPCCGTGAYLVEVLRRIAQTIKDRGSGAIAGLEAKQAASERVFGFEILSAPFVIAHLQIGMALQELGAPLLDEGERAAVYLTNALTGWEPPKGAKKQLKLVFPELIQEQKAATNVKQEKKILVVLGNPPYNAFAGVSTAEEGPLVDVYKEGLVSDWKIKKFNLDDLYVRFFRLGEKRIAEMTQEGIVAYISNFSYLGAPSFVVMRRRLLGGFDKLWFDCMNGDSRETGKVTPEGKPDPSVFSTEHNPEGIRVGTAIGIMVRKQERAPAPIVMFRQFWGITKRQDLLNSLEVTPFDKQYGLPNPNTSNRFSFRASTIAEQYLAWPRLIELCAEPPGNGLMEKRGGALFDINRLSLEQRMRAYFNPMLSWEQYRDVGYGLVEPQAGFDPEQVREKALAAESFEEDRTVRYALRPFDTRWCYYTPVNPIWNRARPQLWAHCWKGNAFIMTRPSGAAASEGIPFCFTVLLGDNDFLRGHAYYFPIMLGKQEQQPNVSAACRKYLRELAAGDPTEEATLARALWMHVLAIGYAPAYLTENEGGIREDWPRIPLPDSKDLLLKSAALGLSVAGYLDTETGALGVTIGAIRPELTVIAAIARQGGGTLNEAKGELDLTAGWGHTGKDRAVMPGGGRVTERHYSDDEIATIEAGTKALGLDRQTTLSVLGDHSLDVWLNEVVFFKNVPSRVWEYTIGGYQVIKKWLSYREKKVLGRRLMLEELEEVTGMARRITAILLLEPKLDANYQAVKAAATEWPPK